MSSSCPSTWDHHPAAGQQQGWSNPLRPPPACPWETITWAAPCVLNLPIHAGSWPGCGAAAGMEQPLVSSSHLSMWDHCPGGHASRAAVVGGGLQVFPP